MGDTAYPVAVLGRFRGIGLAYGNVHLSEATGLALSFIGMTLRFWYPKKPCHYSIFVMALYLLQEKMCSGIIVRCFEMGSFRVIRYIGEYHRSKFLL